MHQEIWKLFSWQDIGVFLSCPLNGIITKNYENEWELYSAHYLSWIIIFLHL